MHSTQICTAVYVFFFFFNDTATTEIYPLPLHDSLPISSRHSSPRPPTQSLNPCAPPAAPRPGCRSEEHTSQLQSPCNLVCRLLLEKKKTGRLSRVIILRISSAVLEHQPTS